MLSSRDINVPSPLWNRFSENSLLREFFDDQATVPPDASWRGSRSPSPETMPVERHFSDHAKELLQRAAEKAVELGNRDVDSEHLLSVLADNDVVQAILKQFKISPEELKDYIDQHAPRGTVDAEKERQKEIGVSPRVKSALDRAMQASVDSATVMSARSTCCLD